MTDLFGETPVTEATSNHFVEVAAFVPLRRTFTYRVPASLREAAVLGARVAVPFGGRKLAAIVIALRDDAGDVPENKVRNIAAVLDPEPVFPQELLSFLRESAEYYLAPLGEVLRAASPALRRESLQALRKTGFLKDSDKLAGASVATKKTLRIERTGTSLDGIRLGSSQRQAIALLEQGKPLTLEDLALVIQSPRAVVRALEQKGLVTTQTLELQLDPFFASEVVVEVTPTPNPAQIHAIDAITARLGQAGGFLLQGVTGSGKTEVYLRVINEARSRQLGALMLVPEIALTPQLVSRFRARFGDAISVLHSGLSERERSTAWQSLRQGRVTLAIGARSALFAPVPNLGVIVVDEEHDSSFKQEEGFRYQARDMALLRAHRAGAICVLGSATPSFESRQLADRGKLTLLRLPERATAQSLPSVELVDLAREKSGPSHHPLLTGSLERRLRECLDQKGQAILFLNRRGFSPSMRCGACDEVQECPSCSVALTEHRREGRMRCHYCDFSTSLRASCLSCGAEALEAIGVGTERLQDALASVFPNHVVARLDRDTAAKEGVEEVLARLRRKEIDILVGTQMVTKGHDIPGVTLVGVILADQSLAFPDFRASERTFQLLSQVAGRAGRGEHAGRVLLQTYQPRHEAIVHAMQHDYEGFYARELTVRNDLGYPPYSRLVAVRCDAAGEDEARSVATMLGDLARAHPAALSDRVTVLGPAPAPIARIRARYRFRLLMRSADRAALRAVAESLVQRIEAGIGAARASVDVDPYSML